MIDRFRFDIAMQLYMYEAKAMHGVSFSGNSYIGA